MRRSSILIALCLLMILPAKPLFATEIPVENISTETVQVHPAAETSVVTEALATSTLATTMTAKLRVNNSTVQVPAYIIDDLTYYKLRDLAYILTPSAKQFDVWWDEAGHAVNLVSHTPYNATGSELTPTVPGRYPALACNTSLYQDGQAITPTCYNIADHTYVQLRDIGTHFALAISWDEETQTITIDSN